MRSQSKRSKASNALPQNRLGVITGGDDALTAGLIARLGESKYRPALLVPETNAAGAAFAELLRTDGDRAVVIGSNSPDVPLPFLKRAFQLLKHRDVVIGPAFGGGIYLLGLRAPMAIPLDQLEWGSRTALEPLLSVIERTKVSMALVPAWYLVDDAPSQQFFAQLTRARAIAQRSPSHRSERATPSEK